MPRADPSTAELVRWLEQAEQLIARVRVHLTADGATGGQPRTQVGHVRGVGWMSVDDIDVVALGDAVERLPEVFDTYHVVDDEAFRDQHTSVLASPAFKQLVGKRLRRQQEQLNIEYLGKRGRSRSALWKKRSPSES